MTTYDRRAAVGYALGEVGWAYQEVDAHHDGMTPGAVDCSGATLLAARAGGVELPHQSAQQSIAPRVHTFGPGRFKGKWMREWLQPGDLVFYYGRWPDRRTDITHVAMYVGLRKVGLFQRRMIVNATGTGGKGVELITLFAYARPCAYGFIDHAPGT